MVPTSKKFSSSPGGKNQRDSRAFTPESILSGLLHHNVSSSLEGAVNETATLTLGSLPRSNHDNNTTCLAARRLRVNLLNIQLQYPLQRSTISTPFIELGNLECTTSAEFEVHSSRARLLRDQVTDH